MSPLGREWLVPLRDDGSIPWTVLSNYPVQGSGADLMMIGRLSLFSRLKKGFNGQSMRAKLVSTVHDDIKLDVPDEEVDHVVRTAYEVFDDIPKNVKKLFNVELPIPFPGEVSIGYELQEKYKVLSDGTKVVVNPRGMEKVSA